MLNTTIGFNQQFPLIAKVLGIVLLFVLNSCPIKASIKQNLYQDTKTESRSNKSAKPDSWIDYEAVDCSVANEQIKAHDLVVKDFQVQPAVIALFSLALILFSFLPRKEVKNYHWNSQKTNSNDLFLQFRRLNL